MLLLGCASLLASVALGQDLVQLGKLQVRGENMLKKKQPDIYGQGHSGLLAHHTAAKWLTDNFLIN